MNKQTVLETYCQCTSWKYESDFKTWILLELNSFIWFGYIEFENGLFKAVGSNYGLWV